MHAGPMYTMMKEVQASCTLQECFEIEGDIMTRMRSVQAKSISVNAIMIKYCCKCGLCMNARLHATVQTTECNMNYQ